MMRLAAVVLRLPSDNTQAEVLLIHHSTD